MAGTLYTGSYFLFLSGAADTHPVKVQFKDHEVRLKTQAVSTPWREKIHLSQAILQRKWLDYKYRERYIPAVRYDNVLPLDVDYSFINEVGREHVISIRSNDKVYRNPLAYVKNSKGERVWCTVLEKLSPGKAQTFSLSIDKPGVYTICFSTPELHLRKTQILYYRHRFVLTVDNRSSAAYRGFQEVIGKGGSEMSLFCRACKAPCFPAEPLSIPRYIHKNYIPIKEYLDLEHIGKERITRFIMGMDHPMMFKRGLVHLLNMLRLASLENEITIITNLFKDDPPFAYFITDRLFLFNMIPLMNNRELQSILNHADDSLLAGSLHGQNGELVAKVLNNISRRRSENVRHEMHRKPKGFSGSSARREMHTLIKTYFEQRYGRSLKIPSGTSLRYRKVDLPTYIEDQSFGNLFNHEGSFLFHTGTDIYEVISPLDSRKVKQKPEQPFSAGRCAQYSYETYLTDIFTLHGVCESTIYLASNFGISLALIHMYSWNDSLEDVEQIENLGRNTIIPIPMRSSAVILTIGAIDARGRIGEQIIRLQVKDT